MKNIARARGEKEASRRIGEEVEEGNVFSSSYKFGHTVAPTKEAGDRLTHFLH